MDTSLRARRVANEWGLLSQIAIENPRQLEVSGRESLAAGDVFSVVLRETTGIVRARGFPVYAESHPARLVLPRFFPSVPLEVWLAVPVFHPNVDPENGFVCVWDRFAAGDTVWEALGRLQAIVSWNLVNLDARHLLQPDAAAWQAERQRSIRLPLPFTPLAPPPSMQTLSPSAPSQRTRTRLSQPGPVPTIQNARSE